ncbi:DUF1934 domain-containing protein [Clostridium uliginosum]|uniref:Uncharacterized beta-barrel protein YwiB, DUF1934 family n=1 Tax=Clostridium uliginosum TaxID=119641 RepID=A0A1I1ID02_9CLOT|nr:DUF1934 domain-containing protein [Clostridium uliginosum]SFC33552.1 Uncharacterized beta-barrel protein YwiB, DUF1934 family [Clostridium uliginosum]
MKKRAIITIKSNASMENDDLIEVISPGDFYMDNDTFKAEYDETEISGMDGTRTILTVRGKSFTLERKGSTATKMDFKNRQQTTSLYQTPYGVLQVNIDTKKLNIDINEEGGIIEVNYLMTIEGQIPMNTNLSVHIKTNEN